MPDQTILPGIAERRHGRDGRNLKGVGQMGLSAAGIGGMYHDGVQAGSSESEQRRLETMDEKYAFDVSSRLIRGCLGELNLSHKPLIADIGCGDSTLLGRNLLSNDIEVLSFDIRPEAVAAQRAAGIDSEVANATSLPILNDLVDVSHTRFTRAWMSPLGREQALAETLRIGNPENCALIVADYDWSVVEGPKEFTGAINLLTNILRKMKFDPDYGRKLPAEFRADMLAMCGPEEPGKYTIEETRTPTYEGVIGGAVKEIQMTARAVIDQLNKNGFEDVARQVENSLVELLQYAKDNPESHVKLPDIVSVSAVIFNKKEHLTDKYNLYSDLSDALKPAEVAYDMERHLETVVYDEITDKVTGLVIDPDLTERARRVQAAAYLNEGLVTPDGIGDDWTLNPQIDSLEERQRSRYFVTLNSDRTDVLGVVRGIDISQEGADSLAVIERLREKSPITYNKLLEHDMMKPGKRIMEVSALAENLENGTLQDVLKSVIALGLWSQKEKYDYGVLDLQEKLVSLIVGALGSKSVRLIDGEDAYHSIDRPGVSDKRRYVPMYVDGATFPDDVLEHAQEQISKGNNVKFYEEIVRSILDYRAQPAVA